MSLPPSSAPPHLTVAWGLTLREIRRVLVVAHGAAEVQLAALRLVRRSTALLDAGIGLELRDKLAGLIANLDEIIRHFDPGYRPPDGGG